MSLFAGLRRTVVCDSGVWQKKKKKKSSGEDVAPELDGVITSCNAGKLK